MFPENNKKEEMSFLDSSLSSIAETYDATLSDDEYRSMLVTLLQPILDQRFPNNIQKQKIRIHTDRLNFSCPYCSDSMKSDQKRRGNIILKGKFLGYFKCFNCSEFHRVDKFFKDFNVDIDLKTVNYISNNISDFSKTTHIKYDMSAFLDMSLIEKLAIDREEFKKYFSLLEVKGTSIESWLKGRLQYDFSKFLYNERLNHLIILNLTKSGKILGLQKRTFKGQNKYLTYKLSKLYELMKKNPVEILDEIDALSQLFNICLIDYTRPITLFEGPLDSFLFKPNGIANAGIHKNFPFDLQLRYFYDYDKTGIEKSIEKLNNSEYVFLWKKIMNDLSLPERPKWDINDLFIWCRKNNIKVPNLENYFSNDPLDLIDI